MSENINTENSNNQNIISSKTQIVFSVKSFFGLIGSMVVIFFGFYQLVIVPRINLHDEQYKTIIKEQKEQNKLFYDELGEINNAINALNISVTILNKERSYQIEGSTSGSLGTSIDFSKSSNDSLNNTDSPSGLASH
ncbi:MAG: hypothetical protein ACOC3V_01205 [bacterium]